MEWRTYSDNFSESLINDSEFDDLEPSQKEGYAVRKLKDQN